MSHSENKKFGFEVNSRLLADMQDGVLILIPQPKSFTRTLRGLHAELWEKVDAERYLAEERNEWTAFQND